MYEHRRLFIYRSEEESHAGSKVMMLVEHVSVGCVETQPYDVLVGERYAAGISFLPECGDVVRKVPSGQQELSLFFVTLYS